MHNCMKTIVDGRLIRMNFENDVRLSFWVLFEELLGDGASWSNGVEEGERLIQRELRQLLTILLVPMTSGVGKIYTCVKELS
ncbi:hypothetical protein Tco_1170012 [Tanacetum coccineum]